ncbi:MAG: hypothetical protein H0X24_17420 [Ktedonobacterales bacterium]|nr:hypothetical protein [Ktedonobacterales bacterium]
MKEEKAINWGPIPASLNIHMVLNVDTFFDAGEGNVRLEISEDGEEHYPKGSLNFYSVLAYRMVSVFPEITRITRPNVPLDHPQTACWELVNSRWLNEIAPKDIGNKSHHFVITSFYRLYEIAAEYCLYESTL